MALRTEITIKDFIVRMALVDTKCKLLWIDVGSDGTINAASIYNGSELNNIFNIPKRRLYLVIIFQPHNTSLAKIFLE